MKYYFIEVSKELEYKIPAEILDKKVGIVCSVQFMHLAEEICKKFKNAVMAGQVVGCNATRAIKIKEKVDCYFIITEGRFHALEIAHKTGKEVYIATGDKITKTEIEDYERKLRGRRMKYLSSDKLGIIVSLKPGQYHLNLAIALKKKIEKDKRKKAYIFMEDNIDLMSLENFLGVQMFINTACSRIEANNVISYEEIVSL